MNYKIEVIPSFKKDVKKLAKKYKNIKKDLQNLKQILLSNNPKETGMPLSKHWL